MTPEVCWSFWLCLVSCLVGSGVPAQVEIWFIYHFHICKSLEIKLLKSCNISKPVVPPVKESAFTTASQNLVINREKKPFNTCGQSLSFVKCSPCVGTLLWCDSFTCYPLKPELHSRFDANVVIFVSMSMLTLNPQRTQEPKCPFVPPPRFRIGRSSWAVDQPQTSRTQF